MAAPQLTVGHPHTHREFDCDQAHNETSNASRRNAGSSASIRSCSCPRGGIRAPRQRHDIHYSVGHRSPSQQGERADIRRRVARSLGKRRCVPCLIVVGDSYASTYVSAVQEQVAQRGVRTSVCRFVLGLGRPLDVAVRFKLYPPRHDGLRVDCRVFSDLRGRWPMVGRVRHRRSHVVRCTPVEHSTNADASFLTELLITDHSHEPPH